MKQETNTMQPKEGLHTQEWIEQTKLVHLKSDQINIYALPIVKNDYPVCYVLLNSKVSHAQAKANAELIVKAVNERPELIKQRDEAIKELQYMVKEDQKHREETKALLDSHREMLAALKEAKRMYEKVQPVGGWQGVYDEIRHAITNAQKLHNE